MKKRKGLFKFILGVAAIFVAVSAAFYSVFGLSNLFAGAKTEVIIMASGLEFSKIMLASLLYRYWGIMKKFLKIYLTSALIVLMIITSAGIYGYLSAAYSSTSTSLEINAQQVEFLEKNKSQKQQEYDRNKERYNILIESRKQQETRLDTLYNRRSTTSAKRTENLINISNDNINVLDSTMTVLSQEISKINSDILILQSESSKGEIGPLKFIAKLTGWSMDKVSSIFILLLIIVFDPLAISLIISVNMIIVHEFSKTDEKIENKSELNEEHIHSLFSFKKKKKIEKIPIIEEKKEMLQEEPKSEIKEEEKQDDTGHWKHVGGGGVRA